MHLGYYVCGALAVGVGVFSSSVDTALPAPHVGATLLPVATSSPRPANFSGSTYINGSHVNEKYGGSYPYQQIINPCPEKIGWPILLCSACGGESPQFPGHCHGNTIGTPRFCKCTDVGPNGVTTSLVTKTVGWATAVATFELEILTEYKNLRQSITVTSTFSTTATTTSSAGSGIETAAVVVLAGGVAWFLADITGPVAIMNIPAPQNAKGHDDDKSCPNPKDKCSDCGGSTQMCTTGANTGCACEEATCPASGSQEEPVCTDSSCAGNEGKCTSGDHKNCDCKEQECPDLKKIIFICDNDCGGKDENGKCLGDPAANYQWKGCDCMSFVGQNSAPLYRPDRKKHQQALANLPKIIYSGRRSSTAPPKPTATPCVKVTLDNCIYQYETLSAGQPCPTIPVLPASCAPTTSTIPTITPTPTPTLGPQQCFPSGHFGHVPDVWPDLQVTLAKQACRQTPNYLWGPDTAKYRSFSTGSNGSRYSYFIWWNPKCDINLSSQNANMPIQGNQNITCMDLFTNDYTSCNNGGIGGYIQAGCLIYEFAAVEVVTGEGEPGSPV